MEKSADLNVRAANLLAKSIDPNALGIDPIHLGIVVTMGVELSVITPPVGFNLYAVSGIAKIPIQTVLRGAMIFFVSDLIVTILIILFPELSTWLPSALSKSPFG